MVQELRTLDYSAARLGRGTWMPQGLTVQHSPFYPCVASVMCDRLKL